jgi:hypothetical protein
MERDVSRREYRATFRCAGGTCRETVTYVCETRAEQDGAYKRNAGKAWKCSRHRDPDANLRPGNESTRHVLVASRVDYAPDPRRPGERKFLDGLYWLPEGAERAGSGLTHGPGFNAHASDFPEGTRLTVTTQIEMPEGGQR